MKVPYCDICGEQAERDSVYFTVRIKMPNKWAGTVDVRADVRMAGYVDTGDFCRSCVDEVMRIAMRAWIKDFERPENGNRIVAKYLTGAK